MIYWPHLATWNKDDAMQRSRGPWWMYFLAVVFLAHFGLRTYCLVFGPYDFGFTWTAERGQQVVTTVGPGSPAAWAGVVTKDVLLAVDGHSPRGIFDWGVIFQNLETGHPYRFEVERQGKRLEFTFPVRRINVLKDPGAQIHAIWNVAALILLATAFLVGFSRPYDFLARWGALALAAISGGLYLGELGPGSAAIWRSLPLLVGAPLWAPHICGLLFGPICLTFFVLFPRPLFEARWPWALIWLPSLPFALTDLYFHFYVVYRPEEAFGILPDWVQSGLLLLFPLYGLAAFAALIANYFRLTDTNEKRRLRLLCVGGGAGILPSLFTILIWVVAPGLLATTFLGSLGYEAFRAAVFVLFPVCFAYAILRHRLLDVQVMIRQGLQYALARGMLISLVPVLGIILLADLLMHGNQPLISVVSARGWMYAAVGGLALIAHMKRHGWLEALDRRFFRERYDAQRLLREVVEDVREAHSFERVAPRVVARIEAALHPEFAAMMVREPGGAGFRCLAAAPSGQAPASLPAKSKLLTLLRVLGEPLEVTVTDSGWLKQQLPQEETDFLREARIDLVVPVAIDLSSREVLLALGVKRSEEPYTQEDEDLLAAIAASLFLLLEKPAPEMVRVSEAFEECPQCGTCYDSGAGPCPKEGANPVPMRLPRLLAGRYRVERRRGRGGMGTVYEAMDTALERRVAVKVIHDKLVGSAEAAERFRREARAAASFAHPNVVTVYDFGSVAETRAFLVMELLEGTTLREELRGQKRSAPSRLVGIMRGVCAAVGAAHRRRLIHRDLKPENIFLSRGETGEITKVLDFGLAKYLPTASQTTADTQSGVAAGTLAYMAPEQLRGQPVDPASDLWALGVITYEMLTGAHPFAGSTGTDYSAVLTGHFTPLDTYLQGSPTRWQHFFGRALHADPTQRPNSAQVFFSELERAFA
jgi:tRNA A-37 threonylcarbamoyl transferase component Bud32